MQALTGSPLFYRRFNHNTVWLLKLFFGGEFSLFFSSYFWYAFNVLVIPAKLLLLTISVYTNTHFKLRLKETRRGMMGEKEKRNSK